jgi:flagellar motility protein MotE (MotC chaperone)
MITNCYTARSSAPYDARVRIIALLLAAVFACGSALAQPAWKRDGRQRQMKQEERERMREDIRDAYRDRRERPERLERGRQMTPEERDKLRRDIESANRELRRR